MSRVRLEPAVFTFYICYGIFFVTNQQLYIEKACKVKSELSPSDKTYLAFNFCQNKRFFPY